MHRYDAIFHLDTTRASVDAATKSVQSDNRGAANVAIVPLAAEGLSVEIVQGKSDEPVQGWASGPWRAVPAVIFSRSAGGPVEFHFVVEPIGKNARAAVRRLEQADSGLRIVLAGGRSLEIQPSAGADGVVVKRAGGR